MRSFLSCTLLAVSVASFADVAQAAAQQNDAAGAPQAGLPLQPARWARFTTTKGTWMSVDVSPDGQTIVFDLLGDLYRMPIAGGKATRITSGIAHDMQPRFSPDGKRIVFVSDRSGDDNVWTVAATAAMRAPAHDRHREHLHVARVDAGRQVHRGRPSRTPLTGLEKLWIYHVQGGTGPAQWAPARRPRVTWALPSAPIRATSGTPAQRALGVQRHLAAVPDRRVRPRDRHAHDHDRALRLGVPARAFARRQVADLRLAARTPRPGSGSATWRAATSAGSPIPIQRDDRNRSPSSTCCRAIRSRPTRRP